MRRGYGYAGGKIILVGEHSVVYNKAAIALPFDAVGVSCSVKEYADGVYLEMDIYQGLLVDVPDNLLGIETLIDEILERLNSPGDLKLILDIQMPPSRGLGYSAAVSTAITKALYDAHETKLDPRELLELVHLAESINHSNPSGLDGYTIATAKPVYFDKGTQTTFEPKFSGVLVVADTGIKGNTKEAVEAVGALDELHLNAILKRLDEAAVMSKKALETNDIETLGHLMNSAQNELEHLGVSAKVLDDLIKSARENGALGAKLTGGGKGGCMIALCRDSDEAKRVAASLLEKGAVKTWELSVGGSDA